MVSIRPGGLRRLLAWSSEGSDPLRSRAAAESWIRALPTESITERGRQVVRLLAEPRPEDATGLTRGGLEALFEIDALATVLVRIQIRRYVAAAVRRDERAPAAWTAAFDLAQSLGGAYRGWLDEAAGRRHEGGWNELLTAVAARYLHYRGVERRLRGLRYEQWIPGKWRELYGVYQAVRKLGSETRSLEASTRRNWASAQTELVRTLLQEVLMRGSFGLRELEWATRYLRGWLPRLTLSALPQPGACWLDIEGSHGLRRPAGGPAAADALFLDLRPVAERLRERLAAHAQSPRPRASAPAANKLLVVLDNLLGGQRTRAARVESQATARVVVGFDATLVNLAFARNRPRSGEMEMGYELRRPLSRFVELNWPPPGSVPAGGLAVIGRIRDVSESGIRLALPAQEWGLRSTGELIGVQEAETTTWRVGVVRRLAKPRSDTIEVGVELLTATPTWVRMTDLDAPASVRSQFTQRGEGPVYGVFVPPGRVARPALLVPVDAFVPGRRLAMPTAHAIYHLGLSRALERGPDWMLVEVRVLAKTAVLDDPAPPPT